MAIRPNTATPAQLSHLFRARKAGSSMPVATLVAIGSRTSAQTAATITARRRRIALNSLLPPVPTDYAALPLAGTAQAINKIAARRQRGTDPARPYARRFSPE